LFYFLGLVTLLAMSGCVVRTYEATKDRVDQDLSAGNRGYIKGTARQNSARKATRTTRVVEVELRSPLKFEKGSKKAAVRQEQCRLKPVTADMSSASPDHTGNNAAARRKIYRAEKRYFTKISQKYYGRLKNGKKSMMLTRACLRLRIRSIPGK